MKRKIIKSLSVLTITAVMLFTQSGCAMQDTKENTVKPEQTAVVKTDEMTKAYSKAESSYSGVVRSVKNNDSTETKKYAESMIESLDSLKSQMEKDFKETEAVLEKYDNNVLNDRFRSYKTEMYSKLKSAESAAKKLSQNSPDTKNNVKALTELFEEKEDYQPTAVPSDATKTELQTETITSDYKYQTSYKYAAAKSEDLAVDTETELTDEIKEKADQLGDAKSVYEYVKNTIAYEPYYGSRKGAAATFEQCGGNDTDQASLLIGMLRYLGIPARYASGTVTITPEQAIALTGAADAENAGRILASQYKPVSRVTKNGTVVCFKMTQTWVEAYVPYTDYRGAGHKNGDSVWVSLDPSFKALKVTEQTLDADYSKEDLYVADRLKTLDSDYSLDKTITVYAREITDSEEKYLPVSLPYQLISKNKTYSSVPASDKYRISVTVGWEDLFSCSTAELYGKNITICYEGEESYDDDLIRQYGGIDKVPAYLVNVVPVAKIGNKEYRGEWGIPLGTKQQMYTYVTNKSGTKTLSDTVTAGSVYAVNLDLQNISKQDAERSYERMEQARKNVNNTGAYSGDFLGPALDYAGKMYFTACDAASLTTSLTLNISKNRQMALAFTGYEMKTESYFGYTKKLHYGNFYIDVAYNNVTAVSYSGNNDDEISYMLTQGMYESSYEGNLWQSLFGDKSFGISTVSVFSVACAKDIDFEIITSANLEEGLAKCRISDSTKNDIRDFVNQGHVVTVVPKELKINKWEGTAYTAIDLKTGSGSYMLSGGTAGGSSSNNVKLTPSDNDVSVDDVVDLCFNVNQVLFQFNVASGLADLSEAAAQMAAASANPVGYLFTAVPLINATKSIASAWSMYYENLDKYCEYMVTDKMEDAVEMIKFTLNNIFDFTKDLLSDFLPDIIFEVDGAEVSLSDLCDFRDNVNEAASTILSGIYNLLKNYINSPDSSTS
ncbi:MAG: transglutaminase family protein [Oscillospiraceae bacterium]